MVIKLRPLLNMTQALDKMELNSVSVDWNRYQDGEIVAADVMVFFGHEHIGLWITRGEGRRNHLL
jgi:hypothetical protein